MSDETVIIEPPKATVHVERKVGLPDYSSQVVSIFLPVDLPIRKDYEDEAAYLKDYDNAVRVGISVAKAHVWDQLGISYEDANGILVEKAAAKVAQSFNATDVPSNRNSVSTDAPAPQQRAPKPAAPSVDGTPACPACGGAVWDNRATKKGRQPDYKCRDKACGKGIWLDKK